MKAIFHHIPTMEELKRNYLLFDELQTSESFLRGNFNLLRSADAAIAETLVDFQGQLDWLFENEFILPNEDIESRLVPEIGSFSPERAQASLAHFHQIDNFTSSAGILEFFQGIIQIRKEFGIRIYSSGAGLFSIRTPGISELDKALSKDAISFINGYSRVYSRLAAIALNRYFDDNNYYPLVHDLRIPTPLAEKEIAFANKIYVVNLTIKKFPVPKPNTSWEKLRDFKADPDSTRKRLALRNWITDVSKQNFTRSEITDRLDFLIREYEVHLENHRIKHRRSLLQTIIVPSMEMLENIAKFKWSKAAKTAFSLEKERHILFEAEEKLPGKELAYIHKAKSWLNSSSVNID